MELQTRGDSRREHAQYLFEPADDPTRGRGLVSYRRAAQRRSLSCGASRSPVARSRTGRGYDAAGGACPSLGRTRPSRGLEKIPPACSAPASSRNLSGRPGVRDQAGRSILAGTLAVVERATAPVGRRRGRRYGLVLLEDDDAFAEALTELFAADGRIEVAGRAREGREGVDLVDALAPDVVLTDIALPVMDGVEATREILRRHPGMPVVAITGWEYEERALEVREAGAVDYVSKSRLGPDLVEVLVAAARARRGAPSGPSPG